MTTQFELSGKGLPKPIDMTKRQTYRGRCIFVLLPVQEEFRSWLASVFRRSSCVLNLAGQMYAGGVVVF